MGAVFRLPLRYEADLACLFNRLKRQGTACYAAVPRADAVSYTHLDVYKRQGESNAEKAWRSVLRNRDSLSGGLKKIIPAGGEAFRGCAYIQRAVG